MIGSSERFHLSKQQYIHQLLEKAQLLEAEPINTPLLGGTIISKSNGSPWMITLGTYQW